MQVLLSHTIFSDMVMCAWYGAIFRLNFQYFQPLLAPGLQKGWLPEIPEEECGCDACRRDLSLSATKAA